MNLQAALKKCVDESGATVQNGSGRVLRRASKDEAHLHVWIDDGTGMAANVPVEEAIADDWTVTPGKSSKPPSKAHAPDPAHHAESERPSHRAPHEPEVEHRKGR